MLQTLIRMEQIWNKWNIRSVDAMMVRCWISVVSLLWITSGMYAQTTVNSRAISMGEHPRDTVGVVGGIVTLRCVVQNKGKHSVYWFRHGAHKYLSKDQRIFRLPDMPGFMSRISIQGNAIFGEFNLRISNVSVDDNDQYSCMYFLDQQFVGMSDPASLTVYRPPSSAGPSCDMEPPTGMAGPGVKVTMVCTSTGAFPYTRLDWKHRVEILPGTLVQGPRPKVLYEVRLSEMDNGASFTCEETSPALFKPRKCVLKPFFIPTNVTVYREPQILSTGADVVIRCNVQAVPRQVNYTWTINNRNLTTVNNPRIKVEDNGKILRIVDIRAEDNGTLITCAARNVLNLEASDYTTLTMSSEQLQSGVAESGGSSKNIAIIGGIVATLAMLIFAALLAVKKKRQMMSKEKPGSRPHQARFSDCEYLEENGFGGVAICNTPRDAIAEHLKQNPNREKGPNQDGETATRVLLVAGPPKTRDGHELRPVLPPLSPLSPPPPIPSPISPSMVSPISSPISSPVSSPVLASNEIPPTLPSMAKHRVAAVSPVKRFPADRLPGMPGKYHVKGPLPRPPKPPVSPKRPGYTRNNSPDLLRC